jgi:hypothetical protein
MATTNQTKHRQGQAKKNYSKLNKEFVEPKASIKKMEGDLKKCKVVVRSSTAKAISKDFLQGYKQSSVNGVYIPKNYNKPVPSNKLRAGFLKAKDEINDFVAEIVETMTKNYVISEIELSASFNADGKFMGFGVGGSATIKIKITPE